MTNTNINTRSLIDRIAERIYNDRHTGTWAQLIAEDKDHSRIQKYRNVANSALLAIESQHTAAPGVVEDALSKCKMFLTVGMEPFAGDAHANYESKGGLQRLPLLVLVNRAIKAMGDHTQDVRQLVPEGSQAPSPIADVGLVTDAIQNDSEINFDFRLDRGDAESFAKAAIKAMGDASTRKDEEEGVGSMPPSPPSSPASSSDISVIDEYAAGRALDEYIRFSHNAITNNKFVIHAKGHIFAANELVDSVLSTYEKHRKTEPVSVDLDAGARAIRGFQEMIGYDDLRMAIACAKAWGLKYD